MTDAPSCSDCAHCSHGWCVRSIGRHFNAGFNGYRSRLNVSCANERASERTLTRRWKCGASGRYFEPKGVSAPMGETIGAVISGGHATACKVRDTIADSDGDDGA